MGEWSGRGLRPSGTVFRQGVTKRLALMDGGIKRGEWLADGNCEGRRVTETSRIFQGRCAAINSGRCQIVCFRNGCPGRWKNPEKRSEGLKAVLVGGAAIGGRDNNVLQLMPADADDGIAFGVDRRAVKIAGLDVGD